MKKLFTLLIVMLLWQSAAVAQSFLQIITPEDTTEIPMAELDSVTIRDVNFYGEKWKRLGQGYYTEDIVLPFFGMSEYLAYPVEIEENSTKPGLYRIVEPYEPCSYLGKYDFSKKHYMVIDAQNPDKVVVKKCYTGLDLGYGEIMIWSMSDYYLDLSLNYGTSYEKEIWSQKAEEYYGTLRNGRITFPKYGLIVSMTIDNIEQLYYSKGNERFEVILPGYGTPSGASSKAASGQHRDGKKKMELNINKENLFSTMPKAVPQQGAAKTVTDEHGMQNLIIR